MCARSFSARGPACDSSRCLVRCCCCARGVLLRAEFFFPGRCRVHCRCFARSCFLQLQSEQRRNAKGARHGAQEATGAVSEGIRSKAAVLGEAAFCWNISREARPKKFQYTSRSKSTARSAKKKFQYTLRYQSTARSARKNRAQRAFLRGGSSVGRIPSLALEVDT